WQLARSVAAPVADASTTETPTALTSVAKPNVPVTDPELGHMITTRATLVPGDFVVLSDRLNFGVSGYWLVGHATTSSGDLAVALGWAPSRAAAVAAEQDASIRTPLVGRYLPSESPDQPGVEKGQQSAASVPALVNQWSTLGDSVYGGYVVVNDPSAGLRKIDSPAPTAELGLNWLNLFYALEWALFAGFAIYLWYRLVKDEVEKLNDPDPDLVSDLGPDLVGTEPVRPPAAANVG
ncbi:MAG: SURF1 family protein, partial [Actinomycetota bacterium]|nr:SURF1 family protein [Actinomycetota bacterium]